MIEQSPFQNNQENFNHLHPDQNEIDVHESWNVNYWCDEFNLRADELKEIVKKVGPVVHEVRKYMAKKLMVSWPAYV